jgi:DNA repair ATPase RecN
MSKSLEQRIADIKAKTAELKKVEDEYQTVKEKVAEMWKQYFAAAPVKKALQEKRKAMREELAALIEADSELKTLLSSIK